MAESVSSSNKAETPNGDRHSPVETLHGFEAENDAQFRTLADLVPTLCWMASADGWLFWYNARWYEYTGTTPEQMKGWGWQAVHDPAVLPQVMERWQASIASGQPFEMTFPLKGADGIYRPFLTRIIPVRGPDGAIIRWYGANTDVTDERRTAEMLERLVEERTAALQRLVEERRLAEEAMRQSEKLQAIGQLTGGIAHDFNNILQVVANGVVLLSSPRVSAERKALLLDGIERSAQSGIDLVGRLLAFARKQVLKPETFDVNKLLGSMTDLLRRTLGSPIEVATDFEPELWPVLADAGQFEVAVLNLAVNARDAMPMGGKLTLSTRNQYPDGTAGRMSEEHVCVTVEDTGVGMPPAVLARIFEPFFTTKEVGKGTGLGLPQVHGFARQSGGDISVKSSPADGTAVTICLPRAAFVARGTAASEADLLAERESASPAAMAHAAGKTVLVVEDNAEVAALASTMLEGLGYTIRYSGTAADALALLASGEKVDVLFSDVAMPGKMDGVALAETVSVQYPHIAMVLATGYSEKLNRLAELPVAVLAKPYGLNDLATALVRALRRQSTD